VALEPAIALGGARGPRAAGKAIAAATGQTTLVKLVYQEAFKCILPMRLEGEDEKIYHYFIKYYDRCNVPCTLSGVCKKAC